MGKMTSINIHLNVQLTELNYVKWNFKFERKSEVSNSLALKTKNNVKTILFDIIEMLTVVYPAEQ